MRNRIWSSHVGGICAILQSLLWRYCRSWLCFVICDEWFRATLQFSILSISVAVLMAAVIFSDRYRYVQIVLNFSLTEWIGVLKLFALYLALRGCGGLETNYAGSSQFSNRFDWAYAKLCLRHNIILHNRKALYKIASSVRIASGLARLIYDFVAW